MNYQIVIAILSLMIVSCGSQNETAANESIHALEDVLTFELSFGAENLPDEYLLARPRSFTVAENGDIIVPDESRLKIFDNNGNPKKIVGRRGQGPGEFGGSIRAYSMENGKTGVVESSTWRLSLFESDYILIGTRNLGNNTELQNLFEKKGWGRPVFSQIYAYSLDDIIIYSAFYTDRDNFVLLHKSDERIEIILESYDEILAGFGPMALVITANSMFTHAVLSDRRVAYSDRIKDKIFEENKWYYMINIYNLDTKIRTIIKQEFNPVMFPDSVLNPPPEEGYNKNEIVMEYGQRDGSLKKVTRKEQDETQKQYLLNLGFQPPIQKIMSDKNRIFVITPVYNPEKGYIFDIFDSDTREYVSSAWFPFLPSVVKNGYAYRIKQAEDAFPVVEKYRIDPAVYRK